MLRHVRTNPARMPQCRVCMDEFQVSGAKKPKVLPCQHTFCGECSRDMETDGRYQCPLCMEICQKANEELQNNFPRLQLDVSNLTSSPNESTSRTSSVDDMISAMRTCYEEPEKLLPQLKAFRHARETTQFQAEHVMMVMLCMEHYAQNPLQQPDIIIVCIQIVHDMISNGLATCMSFAVQEKLTSDVFDVLTVSSSIRSSLRSPCVDILFGLSKDGVEKSYTRAYATILFELLAETMQSQEDAKLIFTIRRYLLTADEVTKDELGSTYIVKIVLERIREKPGMNFSRDNLLGILISLTDLATVPCRNIIAEGGLDILKRILEEQEQRQTGDVISSAIMLLNNISVTPDLRKDIIKNTSLVQVVLGHLHSQKAEISIQSASTIANLASVEPSEWVQLLGDNDIRAMALTMLRERVLVWIAEDPFPGRMPFSEKSFTPYFPLLQMYNAPPCQLYAAWIIRKFCTDEKEKYQEILIKEDGFTILFAIKENESTDETLRTVVEDIILCISTDDYIQLIR